jgi:Ser/Thr protein kinase RdoA (MazF antagonist)
MLSRGDAGLVQRERMIPGMATLLDTGALTGALQAHLPGVTVLGASMAYVHYKPATCCLVAGRLHVPDRDVLFYAKAYGADAPDKLVKSRRLGGVTGPFGPGTIVLDDIDTAVYFFPVDHVMKSLRRLADPETRRNLLKRLFAGRPELQEATLHTLTYKPERRYVARLDTADGPQAVIKFYTPDGYAAASAAADAYVARGALQFAREAGRTDQYHGIAYDWHPGYLLRELIHDEAGRESDKVAVLERVGAALAELHGQAPDGPRQRTLEDELKRVDAQAVTVGQLVPGLQPLLRSLKQRISGHLAELPRVDRALHGDFYDRQVLITDGRILILDLDQAQWGDPAADLGLFMAHMERDVLRNELTLNAMQCHADAFVSGYRRACPEPPPDTAIRLYTAIGLFYLSAEPFRYRVPEWPARIEAMLARAEALLAGLGRPAGNLSGTAGSGGNIRCLSEQ